MADAPKPLVPDHELLRVIGRGSYGEVWLARNVMGTYRAVKVVRRAVFSDAHPFEREFRGIQKFEPVSRAHSGLMDILQIGRGDGFFYYVMEVADDVVSGQEIDPEHYAPRTLRSEVAGHGRLPIGRCLDIGLALVQALGHLHAAGLVHRDVKPSNIIFVHGQPKLADIGLVSELSEARSFVGTEGFIPPEGPGSAQADLFGLGKLLYEIATGNDRNQFPALPREVILGSGSEAGLQELNAVLLRACEAEPARRYRSTTAMQDDLLLLKSGRSVRRAQQLERRLALALRLGLAAALFALAAGGFSVWTRQQARRERENAAKLQAAETQSRDQRWNSLLAQALAGRRSGGPGQRLNSLVAISNAAVIRPSLELRNEAVAALAMSDLGPPQFGRDTPWVGSHPQELAFAFDADLHRVALMAQDSSIYVHRVADHAQLHHLPPVAPGADTGARLVFSPDGQRLAARYGTGDIRCWSLEPVRLLVATRQGTNLPYSLAFSPDNSWLLAGAAGRELHGYSLAEAARDNVPDAPLSEPTLTRKLDLEPKRLAPDGQGTRLVISDENQVQIWSWPVGTLIRRYPPNGLALGFAWHPDNHHLIAGASSEIHVRALDDSGIRRSLRGHDGPVDILTLHPRGDLLASGAWDGTTRLWDMATESPLLTTEEGLAPRFSRDGRALGFRHATHRYGVWPVVISSVFRSLPVAQPPVVHGSLDFSADGQTLLWADRSGLSWVSLRDGYLNRLNPPGLAQARFNTDSSTVILASSDGLSRWRLGTGGASRAAGPQWIGTPELVGTNRFPLSQAWPMAASADRAVTVAGEAWSPSFQNRILIWDERGAEQVLRSPMDALVYSTALSVDRRWLALGHYIGSTCVVDTHNKETVKVWPGLQFAGVGFTPDGRWLITGTGQEYQFWRTGTWEPGLKVPRGIAGLDPARMAFSPDGHLMAILKGFRTIELLDWKTGTILAELIPPRPQHIRTFTFSPDGGVLAVMGQHAVHLWDLRELRRELAGLNLDWGAPPYPPSTNRLGDLVFRYRPDRNE